MKPTEYSTDRRKAALLYVKLGLPIIPICPPEHQGMNKYHEDNCNAKGKAPIISKWPERTKTVEDEVRAWFDKNPHINIGVPLGSNSGMIGVDIDGEEGQRMLEDAAQGELPNTWEFTTGNGRRILYRLPDGVSTKKFKQTAGRNQEFALICDGQQTVLPPSIHTTGEVYRWEDGKGPLDINLAKCPSWALDLVTGREQDVLPTTSERDTSTGLWEKDNANPTGNDTTKLSPPVTNDDFKQTVGEGKRNDTLTKLAGSMLGRGMAPEIVLEFLLNWNREHCRPPLLETEIKKMVQNIALSEQMKRVKRGGAGDPKLPVFRPTPFMRTFLERQRSLGYVWKYAADQGIFYKCDDATGPWKYIDLVLVQAEVRRALTDEQKGGKKSWDNIKTVREAMDAFKALLAKPDEEGLFDLGQKVSLFHTRGNIAYNPQDIVVADNGIINWHTGDLKPWDSETYTTIQLPVLWEPEAKCPIWEKSLSEWIPDKETILFLQEFVGLSLIPDTGFRTAVLLYGSGANGKSLFLDGVRLLFGDALVSIPLHRLTDRFETAYLQNKLVNICGDIDAKFISDTGVLKALIAGDVLRGEYKHGKSFDFVPVCRLMFSSNTLPKVSDKSAAWYSRWKFIEFPRVFPISAAYKIDLMSALDKERNGMLQWAVEGLHRLKEKNTWTSSVSMEQSELDYRMENDNVAAFVEGCIKKTRHFGVETTLSLQALHMLYADWVEREATGSVAVGQIEFSKRMIGLGFQKSRRKIKDMSGSVILGAEIVKEQQPVYTYYINNRKGR